MNDFMTLMNAASNKTKSLRKKKPEAEELLFLDKVREVRVSIIQGYKTLVVTDSQVSFDDTFMQYAPAMHNYSNSGLLSIKTIADVTAEDLDYAIFEL